MAYDKKRLDTLIRQGMMPAKSLPILHRALDKLKGGQTLTPYEREGISKLMDKVMGFQFGDDITYNRARLHTQKTRYQTEELTVAENKEGEIIVHDGSEDSDEAKKEKKVKKNAKSKNAPEDNNGEEVKEAVANRPSDKQEGDKESPKQGGSEKPKIDEPNIKQDSKPAIKEEEDLQELSPKTLKSYLHKSTRGDDPKTGGRNSKSGSFAAKAYDRADALGSDASRDDKKWTNTRIKASTKGIKRAVDKLGGKNTTAGKYIKSNLKDKANTHRDYVSAGSGHLRKGDYEDTPKMGHRTKELNREKGMTRAINKLGSKPSLKEGLSSREEDEIRFKKLSKKAGAQTLTKAVRKEKEKAGLAEDLMKFNTLYQQNLETALANNKVDNVRDIPEKIKADLFKHVDEATYSDKQIKMAKGIAFDKRYKGGNMTGAAKQMEKIKKGLSDHPKVSNALRQANEELEQPLDEGSLKDYALGHGYFDNSSEGKAKRADKDWLSKQAGSKKTISYAKKKKPVVKEEEDTKELPKTPNQAVRDVHRTVADVLAGRTIEVSDEPLVVDPNVELQAELDATVNVQEGAREDAMRDIKRDKGHGLAPVKKDPKPGKSKHDGSENKGPDHIVAQLRKAISLGDKHDGVKFQDGKTHKVKASHAHKFLNKYMSGKPADKEKMQSHGHASHDNFKTHID